MKKELRLFIRIPKKNQDGKTKFKLKRDITWFQAGKIMAILAEEELITSKK